MEIIDLVSSSSSPKRKKRKTSKQKVEVIEISSDKTKTTSSTKKKISKPSSSSAKKKIAASMKIKRFLQRSFQTKKKQRRNEENPKIEFVEPIAPEKSNKPMEIIKSLKKFAKTNPMLKYNANSIGLKLYYNYLIKKYDTGCGTKENNGLSIYVPFYKNLNKVHSDVHLENMAQKYVSCIKECIKGSKKFVVSDINVKLLSDNDDGGHANMLLYRASNNTLEYFEPHGNEFQGENAENINKGVNNFLTSFVAELNKQMDANNLPKIRLVPTNEICPRKGFQHIEELYFDVSIGKNKKLKKSILEDRGNCALWSLFYAEMCLRNPNFTGKEIVEKILSEVNKLESKKASEYMRKVLRGYRYYIFKTIDEKYKSKFGKKFTEENFLKTLSALTNKKEADISPDKIEISPIDSKSTNESLTSVSSDYKRNVEKFEEKQKAILEKYKSEILLEGEKHKDQLGYDQYKEVAEMLGKKKMFLNYHSENVKKLYQRVWLKYMNEMGKTKYGE
jgi:hypothetical protein